MIGVCHLVNLIGKFFFKERCVKLTAEEASEFLCHKANDSMKTSLSPGPLIVLCLARADAVESWKRLMGPENCSLAKLSAPTSLRALYGDPDDDTKNAVYGSDGDDDVQHELRFFFPNRKQPNMKMAFINRYYCSRCHLRPHPCVQ